MPAVFLGHGNPMNAIQHNAYTDAWRALAATLPRPRQILSISAHWYLPGSRVTIADPPRTIHDFGGFPEPLFEVQYPARGSPELARRVRALLAPTQVILDQNWASTTEPGPFSCICFPKPTFRSSSSASMRR